MKQKPCPTTNGTELALMIFMNLAADPFTATNRFPIRIGYVPLVDAAPLLVARELGLFEKHGVAVSLLREPGWSSIRDRISYGELDCAHAPIGLSIALTLGQNCLQTPTIAPLMISVHGNAITLSASIKPSILKEKNGLRDHFASLGDGVRKPIFAAVHPWSSHTVMLQSWLARHGLSPKRDVDILYLPPAVMSRNLAAGTIDGFCVGEPWNSEAIAQGSGWVTARSSIMAQGEFEKALIVPTEFAKRQREVTTRLMAAIIEGCDYCADSAHTEDIIDLLARPAHLDCHRDILRNSLGAQFQNGHTTCDAGNSAPFISGSTGRPRTDAADWLITGLRLVGTLGAKQRVDVSTLFDTALHDEATALVGALSPA